MNTHPAGQPWTRSERWWPRWPRTGNWSHEVTTEQIEAALFQGKVARDALAGSISVPSVGNVREAIRAASFTDAELFGGPGEIDANDHQAH